MKSLLLSLGATACLVCGIDLPQFDDSILFSLNWVQNSWKPDELLKEDRDYEVKTMMTPDQEKLKCFFPLQHLETVAEDTDYTGPSALSLLMPSLKGHECNKYKSLSYWSYEVCHGEAIRQFHVESGRQKRSEPGYKLGVITPEKLQELEAQALQAEEQPLGSTRVEGDDLPYVSVLYEGGDICQLTNQPRWARVLYVCRSDMHGDVYSVKETSSCVYEIVAFNRDLCKHPVFWKRNPPKNKVHCMLEESDGELKPKELSRVQKLRFKGLLDNMILMDGMEDFLNMRSPLLREAGAEEATGRPEEGLDGFRETKDKPKTPPGNSFQDLQLVKDFLTGKQCIHSKSNGWWNTKLCYGKEILQYHDNKDGSQMKILLGTFDKQKHIDWMLKHPAKAFPRTRPSAHHLYSDGAVCDVTAKPRHVVVRTVCDGKTSGSLGAVSLSFEEPQPCEYRVTLRGRGLCGALRGADRWGLLDPAKLDVSIFDDAVESGEASEEASATPTGSLVLKSITGLSDVGKSGKTTEDGEEKEKESGPVGHALVEIAADKDDPAESNAKESRPMDSGADHNKPIESTAEKSVDERKEELPPPSGPEGERKREGEEGAKGTEGDLVEGKVSDEL